GHLLEHVLPDQGGVPGGTARGDDDPLEPLELIVVEVETGDPGGPLVVQQVTPKRVAETLRLLADLLQHEMRIAVPLYHCQIPVDLVDGFADAGDLEIADPVAFTSEHRHFAVVEVDDRSRVLQ